MSLITFKSPQYLFDFSIFAVFIYSLVLPFSNKRGSFGLKFNVLGKEITIEEIRFKERIKIHIRTLLLFSI